VSASKRERTQVAFGETLREIRSAAGISQEKLALESGCHRTYVSLLERGLKSPSLSILFRIAEALHIAPSDIVRHVEARLARADHREPGKGS